MTDIIVVETGSQRTSVDRPDFDIHFGLITAAGDRTRKVLYFYCIILICSLFYYLEDGLSTVDKRLNMISAANSCIQLKLGPEDLIPSKQLPIITEDDQELERKKCKFYYDYIERFYLIPLRDKNDQLIIPNVPFADKYKSILHEREEYDFAVIPLLGLKIDRNLNLVMQNFAAIITLSILFLCFSTEIRCLRTIRLFFDLTRDQTQAIVNCHVFSTGVYAFSWWGVVLGLPALQIFKIVDDIGDRESAKLLYGSQTLIFYGSEIVSGLALCGIAGACFFASRSLNSILQEL